jgi:hypothetical protein
MPRESFDRYKKFIKDGEIKPIPGINIPKSDSDKKILYKVGETRLDKVSQEYYGSPLFGWLILLANQEYGGIEFDIPDKTVIRVPFPLKSAIERYITEVEKHIRLYGE